MARPSTIDRLPAEVRELIARRRADGRTIDEIRATLADMDVRPSRSALARHISELDAADADALPLVVDRLRREIVCARSVEGRPAPGTRRRNPARTARPFRI
jgi:hypothetical protein